MQLTHKLIKEFIRIRLVEQTFLDLFSKGLMNGTVHTCIGQELSALAFAGQLKKTDFIFSNHRCHGHYMAYTNDWKGLIMELMGKKNGVCGGVGSSQHLQYRNFFSNGIQGGILPLAAGFAFGNKLSQNNEIGVVYIGDGTLGEGIVYETLNFISINQLPLIVVCENNLYAQSTLSSTTTAGSIEGRAKAFGIEFRQSNTFDGQIDILDEALDTINYVREQKKPVFHLVNTYRLKAHSKGDDDRNPLEIEQYESRDFLHLFEQNDPKTFNDFHSKIKSEINAYVDFCLNLPELTIEEYVNSSKIAVKNVEYKIFEKFSNERLVSRINNALRSKLENNKSILIGEDISDPYGGAFKVTKGLSDLYPEQVFNTTISEALIAGVSNGLALRGFKPYAEFMFGDFMTLGFDQMLNHASKIHNMYNRKIHCGVVYRTPMGAGRGYGPTHSQSLEKHFLGMDTFCILAVNRILDPALIFNYADERLDPTLIIENKVEYGKNGKIDIPKSYFTYIVETSSVPILIIKPIEETDITIISYGGYVDHVLEKIEPMIKEGDRIPKVIIVSQIDPIQEELFQLLEDNNDIVFIEEGIDGGTVGDYFISKIVQRNSKIKSFKNISSMRTAIPSVKSLEKEVLAKLTIDINYIN
jgi:2-oxoisovalerate dehydrogenase E1 component